MKKYVNVKIEVFEEYYDLVYAILYELPFSGIEEKYDELIVSFDLNDWNDEVRHTLKTKLDAYSTGAKIINEDVITERNWNEEWEKSVDPVITGENIGITPEWRKDEIDTPVKIIINPKMSFGTGHHATTRLMCRLMENLVKEGSFWIDAGTGTGILAILAKKLGAGRVLAFDNNDWSVNNSIENIKSNDMEGKIEIDKFDIDDEILPESDGIAANLNKNIVIRSLPKFRKSLAGSNGDLVISGILIYDSDDIISATEKQEFRLVNSLREDEWIAFHLKAE